MTSIRQVTRTSQLAAALMLALGAPAVAGAQQLSANVSVPITITVRPTLAIRSVVPAPARANLTAATVNVESNLPYRLTVRLATTSISGARILVRSAEGGFEPLVAGGSVTTVVSRTGGQRGHEVVCRVESADSERCALIYELSAEHDDMLVRSSATLR